MTMPEPMDAQDFAGPHPTCRELVAQLAAWGFVRRREEGVQAVFRGPGGGTLRVLRSQLGRADPGTVEKAARLAGVTPAQFWAGPEPEPAPAPPPLQEVPRLGPRRQPARDTAISIVLSVHAAAGRPLGFDQLAEMSGGRVTRAQASTASAALCRDGQLDRIRSGVYQWHPAGPQAPAARQDSAGAPVPPAGPGEAVTAAELFGQLFPAGVRMTAELLADLEQWARLTGKLASRQGGTAGELRQRP
jgi:hypothetical protein